MDYITIKTWLTANTGNYVKGKEYDFLYLLIKNHPAYHEWQYNIPLGFKVIKKVGPNKVLQLMVSFQLNKYRIVSWTRCCSDRKNRKMMDPLTSAMRHAIKRQISIYKNKNINKICYVCHHDKKIEVDHYPLKFVKLKEDFINDKLFVKIAIPTTFRYHPKRGYAMFNKTDSRWKKAWQKYHLKLATYRYLCSTCNKKY